MNRNQKIALGCGGGGCLIVILIVVGVVVAIATGVIKAPGLTSYTDSDSNSNSNSSRNDNSTYNRNSNSSVANRGTNSNSSSSSSSMTDDDKHKLFQAGASSQDVELNRKVWEKLGFLKTDGTPNDKYGPYLKEHFVWLFKNSDFIESVNTPEKARAYVNEHIND